MTKKINSIAPLLLGALGWCATLQASTYHWTGGGNDGGLWTTPANWGVSAGYPNGEGDTAVFSSSADAKLDAPVTLQYLDVKAGAAVVVSATEAGSLTMNNTTTAARIGLRVSENAKLSCAVPMHFATTTRSDVQVEAGCELHFRGALTIDGGVFYVTGLGLCSFEGEATVTAPATKAYFGIFARGYASEAPVRFADDAVVSFHSVFAGASSTAAPAVAFSQSGNAHVSIAQDLNLSGDVWPDEMPEHAGHAYRLEGGELTVGGTFFVGGNQSARFVQTDGMATVKTLRFGKSNAAFAGELQGGTLTLTNGSSSPSDVLWFGDGLRLLVSGGRLVYPSAFTPCDHPGLAFGAGEFVLASANGTLSWNFSRNLVQAGATLAYDGTAKIDFGHHVCTYGLNLAVRGEGVRLTLPSHTVVFAPDGGTMKLTVGAGASFRLADTSVRVQAPLDLAVEEDGKIEMPTRNVLVAHRLTVAGVEKGRGRFRATAENADWFASSHAVSSILVPRVWTGAGDGTSWADAANWADDNATCAYSDVSAARTVTMPADETTVGAIVVLPNAARQPVTVAGDGRIVFQEEQLVAAVVVAEDCTLAFDVDVRVGTAWSQGLVGGGTVAFKKSYPGANGNYAPFAIDGKVVYSGTESLVPSADSAANNFFSLWTYETAVHSAFEIVEGAKLDATRLFCGPGGFLMAEDIRQTGGETTFDTFYVNQHNHDVTHSPTYRLEGGRMTVNGVLFLNGIYSSLMTRFPGGSFEMTGGELACGSMCCALNQNYFRLSGGRATVAGDLKAEFSGTFGQTNRNDCAYLLGGVTLAFTGTEARAIAAKAQLTGRGGDTKIVSDGCLVKVSEDADLTGAGGLHFSGDGILDVYGRFGFTGRLTFDGSSWCYLKEASVLDGPRELRVTRGTFCVRGTIAKSPDSIYLYREGALTSDKPGKSMTVRRLVVAGEDRPVGTYTFGTLSVTVERPSEWLSDAAADLSDERADVALAEDTTLESLVYRPSSAAGSTLTLGAADGATLTLADGATIDVGTDDTLVISANVVLAGKVRKTGFGKVVFAGSVTCPASVTKGAEGSDAYWLRINHGSADFDGAVTGVRLVCCSGDGDMPLVTLKANCMVSDYAAVLTAYSDDGFATSCRGETRQEGATVDYTTVPALLKDRPMPLTSPQGGSGRYVLSSGTFIGPRRGTNLSFVRNYDDRGTFEFVQDGGTVRLYWDFLFARNSTGQDLTYTLNGGTLEMLFAQFLSYDRSLSHVNLNGGAVVLGDNFKQLESSAFDVSVGGDVTLKASADVVAYVPADFVGTGSVTVEGPGRIDLGGIYFLPKLSVKNGGTLGIAPHLMTRSMSATALTLDQGVLSLPYEGLLTVAALCVDGRDCPPRVYTPGRGVVRNSLVGNGRLRVLTGPQYGMAIIIR